MAENILTYILNLQDNISDKLKRIGINNEQQLDTWAKVQRQVNGATQTMQNMGRSIGSMNERIAALRAQRVQKKRNPCEKGFGAKRLLLTGWCPSFWRLVIQEVRGLFERVVDVELTDELEAVLEVGSFGLGEGVKETESGDESVLLGLDGHVLLGCGDYLPKCGEEILELMVGDKKLDFWRRNGVFGVVARVVEEVRDAVERACDSVVIIWKRDFYGGG